MELVFSSRQGIALLIGAVTILCLLVRGIYNAYFHPLSKFPGPRSWWYSNLPFAWSVFRGTSVRKMEEMHRQYGPILRVAPNSVSFAQAEVWADLLQLPPGHVETVLKDKQWWHPPPDTPPGLTTAVDTTTHAYLRKAIQPAFTVRALRSQEQFIQRYVDLLIERLAEMTSHPLNQDKEVDIVSWLNFTTFDIFGDLGFGESFGCLENAKFHPWVDIIFANIKAITLMRAVSYLPPLESLLMLCIPPSLRRAQRDHFVFVAERVQRRLNFEFDRPDIMSYAAGERGKELKKQKGDSDGEGGPLSLEAITSVFWELVPAGSETTATLLSGAVNMLLHNGDKLKLLTEEIRGRFKALEEIALDDLQELPYLNAVLREALRMTPPVPWMLPRVIPEKGSLVCGAWIPGGTSVSVHIKAINHNPDYFHHAESFLPERWLPDALDNPTSPFFKDNRQAVQAFLVGPRSCIGQNLAWAEMRLILSKLVWLFDLAPPADKAKWIKWENLKSYIVIEKEPIYVTMKPRGL